jgi:molybdopterin synthase sulfur carrier subunit
VKVFYFAWLKSKTGIGEEDVDPPAEVETVGDLVEWLKTRSPGHAEALGDPAAVRCAVNQDYARDDHPVSASDEIAFFPPVTGG